MKTRPSDTCLPGRIALFGGTFDPVHLGHLIIAETLREQAGLDTVVFIPAANPPHKHHELMFDAIRRYALLQAAVAGNPGFALSDIELVRGGTSYTIDTIRDMKAGFPAGTELLFIVGRDNLYEIEQWKSPRDIVRECRILVADRSCANSRDIPQWLAERIEQVETPLIQISSTDIRQRIREGKSIRYLVPEAVRLMIKNMDNPE